MRRAWNPPKEKKSMGFSYFKLKPAPPGPLLFISGLSHLACCSIQQPPPFLPLTLGGQTTRARQRAKRWRQIVLRSTAKRESRPQGRAGLSNTTGSRGVGRWRISKTRLQVKEGFWLNQPTECLLRAGPGDQMPRVGSENMDQTLRLIRYQGWELLAKRT